MTFDTHVTMVRLRAHGGAARLGLACMTAPERRDRAALSLEWPNYPGKHGGRHAPQQQRGFGRFVVEKMTFKIDEIYVPVKRRKTLDSKVVNEIAESMLQNGQQIPILVRRDGDRFVLVDGFHRLEACKALGEETIAGFIVQARRH